MNRLLAAIAIIVLASAPAFALDADTEALTALYKSHKPVKPGDVQVLMMASKRWCYAEQAGSCSWSDVYLKVTPETAHFEIGSPWSETVDIFSSESAAFDIDGKLCETGDGASAPLYAVNRADGTAITGRALAAIRDELSASQTDGVLDCFDYLYLSVDNSTDTVTLQQRQYADGAYLPEQDVTVTLHFDPERAGALSLRW